MRHRTERKMDALWLVGILVGYIVLNWFILPKLGVST